MSEQNELSIMFSCNCLRVAALGSRSLLHITPRAQLCVQRLHNSHERDRRGQYSPMSAQSTLVSLKVFLGNLPYDATNEELIEHAVESGLPRSAIEDVRIITDSITGRSKGTSHLFDRLHLAESPLCKPIIISFSRRLSRLNLDHQVSPSCLF